MTTATKTLRLHDLLMAAMTVGDLLVALQKVDKPSDGLKKVIEKIEKTVARYDQGEDGEYGRIIDSKMLVELRTMLEKVSEKDDDNVKHALKMIGILLGEEKTGLETPPERMGKLEAYGGEIRASTGRKGWYRAKFIQSGLALNGWDWTAPALQAAQEKGLFENVPVNVYTFTGIGGSYEDHLPPNSPYRYFSAGNQMGFTKNAYWDDDTAAVWGDIYISDLSRRDLIDESLANETDVGTKLSICADGDPDDNGAIHELFGVKGFEFVTYPAADGAIVHTLIEASCKPWEVCAAGITDPGLDSGITLPGFTQPGGGAGVVHEALAEADGIIAEEVATVMQARPVLQGIAGAADYMIVTIRALVEKSLSTALESLAEGYQRYTRTDTPEGFTWVSIPGIGVEAAEAMVSTDAIRAFVKVALADAMTSFVDYTDDTNEVKEYWGGWEGTDWAKEGGAAMQDLLEGHDPGHVGMKPSDAMRASAREVRAALGDELLIALQERLGSDWQPSKEVTGLIEKLREASPGISDEEIVEAVAGSDSIQDEEKPREDEEGNLNLKPKEDDEPSPEGEDEDQEEDEGNASASGQEAADRVNEMQQEFAEAEKGNDASKMEEIAREAMALLQGMPEKGFEYWEKGINLPGAVNDLLERAFKAVEQARVEAGKEETGTLQSEEIGGGLRMNELGKLQRDLDGVRKQQKELQASVAVMTQEREIASSTVNLDEAMETAGIPELLRPRIRELTAGMALDSNTQTGLVKWVKDLHELIAGQFASQTIDVREVLASTSADGSKLNDEEMLQKQVVEYFGLDLDPGEEGDGDGS